MEWKTKSGQILKIKDMSTYHIKNCIKFIENNIDKDNEMQRTSYYMKEIHYERDYDESHEWCEFQNELEKRDR